MPNRSAIHQDFRIYMTTLEERVSRIEGVIPHLATKEDIADLRGETRELRGELRSLRWIMGTIGVGLAALNLALKFLG